MAAEPDPPSVRLHAERLDKLTQRYLRLFRGCRRDLSPVRVHAFRVTSRRLLALFKSQSALMPQPGRSAYVIRQLRRGLRELRELRDSQVFEEIISRSYDIAVDRQSVQSWLKRKERKLLSRASRTFTKKRLARLSTRLPKLVEKISGEQPEALAAALQRAMVKLRRALADVDFSRPKTLHRVRLAWKQYRYLTLFVTPGDLLFSRSEFKAVQDLLGELEDLEAARRLLKEGRRAEPDTARELSHAEKDLESARARVLDRVREVLCGVGELIDPPVEIVA